MPLNFAKFLSFSVVLLLFSPLSYADTCSDPARQQEVCREMKHLRSQILVLGAERDLMQINYPLLQKVGEGIRAGASRALTKMSVSEQRHVTGLIGVQAIAMDLMDQARQKNGEALMTANKMQQQCAACHSSAEPSSGHKWDEIFKSDWSVFYKKCNSADRNPFRCKSMHAMFSYYSGFFTAHKLGLQNYELTELSARRIAALAGQLKDNNLVHGLEDLMGKVVVDATELAQLASEKKPEAFERALSITQTCMQCHADRNIGYANPLLELKPLMR